MTLTSDSPDFVLTKDQQDTLDSVMGFLNDPDEKFFVIQGAAGSGKSTLIRHIVRDTTKFYEMKSLLTGKEEIPIEVLLTATTNPAVAVLEKLTGIEASTIHSLLGLKVVNNFRTGRKDLIRKAGAPVTEHSVIIVDEGSMINQVLKDKIDEFTPKCKIIIIGDQYQLAPVNEKSTMMETMSCSKAYMNKIMRNSGLIMKTGAMFRETVETGVFKPIPVDDQNIIHTDGPTFQQMVDEAFTNKDYHLNSAKVIAWSNKRVLQYNSHIRKIKGLKKQPALGEILYTNKPILSGRTRKPVDSAVEVTGVGTPYTDEDTSIDGRMFEINGECSGFHPDNPLEVKSYMQSLAKRKMWPEYFKIQDEWLDLRSPFASTVHKAQGSSYDQVFIDLGDIGKCRIASDVARMLYVGISRARTQVVLYGNLPTKYRG